MRRRREHVPSPEERLVRFRLPDWYDPAQDPAAPENWPHTVGAWHQVRAFQRYMEAKHGFTTDAQGVPHFPGRP